MKSILDKIVAHKRIEISVAKSNVPIDSVVAELELAPPPRDFLRPLQQPGVGLIAEVKKASPSKGLIRKDFEPVTIATSYQTAGVHCVSVLTDQHFFQGHLDFLRQIRATIDLPILRKDFILDPYQVFEARAAGADAVLLIAECLDPTLMIELHDLVEELGMTALVELYDVKNLPAVLACNPKLVGVNNRDLNTFEVDLNHSIQIRKQVPGETTFVSESGIYTHEDVLRLAENRIDAMLVGESLMRSDDIPNAVNALMHGI